MQEQRQFLEFPGLPVREGAQQKWLHDSPSAKPGSSCLPLHPPVCGSLRLHNCSIHPLRLLRLPKCRGKLHQVPAWYEREEKWLEAQKALDVIYKYRKSNQDAGVDYCDAFKAHKTPADEAVEDARRWVAGCGCLVPCGHSRALIQHCGLHSADCLHYV